MQNKFPSPNANLQSLSIKQDMSGLGDVGRVLGIVVWVVTVIMILQVSKVGQQCLGGNLERLQQITLLQMITKILISYYMHYIFHAQMFKYIVSFQKNPKYVEHRIAKTMQTNGFIEAVTEWVYLDK